MTKWVLILSLMFLFGCYETSSNPEMKKPLLDFNVSQCKDWCLINLRGEEWNSCDIDCSYREHLRKRNCTTSPETGARVCN